MFELAVYLKDRLIGRSTFISDEVRIGRSWRAVVPTAAFDEKPK